MRIEYWDLQTFIQDIVNAVPEEGAMYKQPIAIEHTTNIETLDEAMAVADIIRLHKADFHFTVTMRSAITVLDLLAYTFVDKDNRCISPGISVTMSVDTPVYGIVNGRAAATILAHHESRVERLIQLVCLGYDIKPNVLTMDIGANKRMSSDDLIAAGNITNTLYTGPLYAKMRRNAHIDRVYGERFGDITMYGNRSNVINYVITDRVRTADTVALLDMLHDLGESRAPRREVIIWVSTTAMDDHVAGVTLATCMKNEPSRFSTICVGGARTGGALVFCAGNYTDRNVASNAVVTLDAYSAEGLGVSVNGMSDVLLGSQQWTRAWKDAVNLPPNIIHDIHKETMHVKPKELVGMGLADGYI